VPTRSPSPPPSRGRPTSRGPHLRVVPGGRRPKPRAFRWSGAWRWLALAAHAGAGAFLVVLAVVGAGILAGMWQAPAPLLGQLAGLGAALAGAALLLRRIGGR
jgi:uncharacterized membrane protein YkgB